MWRAADPFVVVAAGRCPFTAEGLLAPRIWLAGSARGGTAARM